jgi:hypothetical protein
MVTTHVLSKRETFAKVGAGRFERLNAGRLEHYHAWRQRWLGYDGALKLAEDAL